MRSAGWADGSPGRGQGQTCHLGFLRPIDFYRGNPTALLANRRRKLEQARALRKQENVKLRQRMIPWSEEKTVA